jgi:glutamate-5-semialdehyde dehydrogenase
MERLEVLVAGDPLVVGGDRFVRVSEELAAAFRAGDSLAVVQETGEILHVPSDQRQLATAAIDRAVGAFGRMATTTIEQVDAFYEEFATALESDSTWSAIEEVNARDVEDAKSRGRSTTRLLADEWLRMGMIEGLRGWVRAPSRRDQVIETVQHDDFRVELVGAPLGVVAFVFEGRPNVLADACGVLKGGNTVVFRIGSDALRTARAIMAEALDPALESAGLPAGAVALVESSAHAAGWSLFSDPRLGLAVARGSGRAVATLGSLARSAGVAVSLHGTGGAWIVAAGSADPEAFENAIVTSLDRKVCNTLNTCCIVRSRADELVPVLLRGLREAGKRRDQSFRLHVAEGSQDFVESDLFGVEVTVVRAAGEHLEKQVDLLSIDELGREWEWEETPEISLVVVDDVDEAVDLFNRYSPLFEGSLLSVDDDEHRRFYDNLNAPFVGDGYTRWVDGQFALHRPELGLSNWQNGRLLGRGTILSGDSVYTLRTRYVSRS